MPTISHIFEETHVVDTKDGDYLQMCCANCPDFDNTIGFGGGLPIGWHHGSVDDDHDIEIIVAGDTLTVGCTTCDEYGAKADIGYCSNRGREDEECQR